MSLQQVIQRHLRELQHQALRDQAGLRDRRQQAHQALAQAQAQVRLRAPPIPQRQR